MPQKTIKIPSELQEGSKIDSNQYELLHNNHIQSKETNKEIEILSCPFDASKLVNKEIKEVNPDTKQLLAIYYKTCPQCEFPAGYVYPVEV